MAKEDDFYTSEEAKQLVLERWDQQLKETPVTPHFKKSTLPSTVELKFLYESLIVIVAPDVLFQFRCDTLWAFINAIRQGEQPETAFMDHIMFPIDRNAFEHIQALYGKQADRGMLH